MELKHYRRIAAAMTAAMCLFVTGALAEVISEPFIMEHEVLQAQDPAVYTVRFVDENGETLSTVTLKPGETLERPQPDPQQPGRVFTGWALQHEDGSTTPYAFGPMAGPQAEIVLVACYADSDAKNEPDKNEKPDEPDKSEKPDEPDKNEKPDEPDKSEKPDEPAQDRRPDEPSKVEKPQEPAKDQEAGKPLKPDDGPAKADKPDGPAAQPDDSKQAPQPGAEKGDPLPMPGKAQEGLACEPVTPGAKRSVRVEASYIAAVDAETQVTLTAILTGFDSVQVQLQWQSSVNGIDWRDVPGAKETSYTYELTEQNREVAWRVVVRVD